MQPFKREFIGLVQLTRGAGLELTADRLDAVLIPNSEAFDCGVRDARHYSVSADS